MIRRIVPIAIALVITCAASACLADPPASQPAGGGYLFVTFKGESTSMTEQIYFGLSNDGLHWDALNDSNPVLVSDVGEKGVRDPYLLRSHDGKKFFLIATDLSINLNRNWVRATHAGSQSIVIWESDDLIHWSKPRLAKVAIGDAGCTWAPEAIYDEASNDYLIYWASTTRSDDFAKQRIWSVRTRDFKTFSEPIIYIEKSEGLIDTDVVHNDGPGGDGKFYRFSKYGRQKNIIVEVAERLAGPWKAVAGFTLGLPPDAIKSLEGPAAFRLSAAANINKVARWCLLLDHPGRGHRPFTSADLASGQFAFSAAINFPFPFRHGSVLRLSAEQYEAVKSAYSRNTK